MPILFGVLILILLGLTAGLTIALACGVKLIMPGYHRVSYLAIAFVIAFTVVFLSMFWLMIWFSKHAGYGA